MKHTLIYTFLFAFSMVRGQNIVISEMNNSNEVLIDFTGDFPDWIEIQNPSSSAISINQIYLTDNRSNLNKWQLPDTTLQPGAYLIVYASGLDTITNTEIHSNFKLKSDGESIYLSSNNVIIDSLKKQCIPSGFSLVKDPLLNSVFWDSIPSPGNSYNSVINIPIDSLSWSHEAGFTNENEILTIESNLQYEVRYNLKGV